MQSELKEIPQNAVSQKDEATPHIVQAVCSLLEELSPN